MLRHHASAAKMTMMVVMMMTAILPGVKGTFEEPDWGFQSYLNETFTLVCDHSSINVEPHNHVEWQLPNGQMLSQSEGRYELTDGLRGSVTHMNLVIQDMHESDAGVYVCYVYNNIRKEVRLGQLLRGLNLGSHKYREPFEEYRENLMVGGLAAVVLFVPLVTACCIYKFRYQTAEQKRRKQNRRFEATKYQRQMNAQGNSADFSVLSETGDKGQSNQAYVMNDNDTLDTRM